jgi:omega-6 fatty acid desaturase (delta-12 desaturase)
LPAALRHYPELAESGRLTLVQSFSCVRLVLWDEARHRLISFRELQTDHRACAHVPFSTSSTP